jgi:hypothetical protein
VSLNYNTLVPGVTASRESIELALVWGPIDSIVTKPVVLSSTTVDARSTVTTELRPGLVLGKVTGSHEYQAAVTAAGDGPAGILAHHVNMLGAAGSAVDQLALMIVGGPVKAASCGGLNATGRAALRHIIWDDEDGGASANAAYRGVPVAKTADYTVVAADNGKLFTTQGASAAVTFTLPALAAGLRYGFYNEADQDMIVAAATADTMVVFNDLAADSIAFSTTAEQIGSGIEVMANADATKWLVWVYLGAETVTPTIAT